MITEAENPISAKVGDKVSLRINSKRFLGSTMLVFGLPLLALFMGILAINVISDNQIFSLSVGFILFLLSFIPIKIYDKHLRKTNACSVTIVEIVEEKS